MSQSGSLTGGSADAVTNPSLSSSDNAIARFDGTSGLLIQNSSASIDDAGNLAAVSITLTNPLAVADGGTGVSTLTGVLTGNGVGAITGSAVTQYGVLIGGASNAVASTAVGTAGQVLTSNGAGLAPTFQTAAAGGVTSVSGTLNRISSTGGATPVIDIDAAYVGQASITTLGTITTGVWNGTDIAVAAGGTGVSSLTDGGILLGSGVGAVTITAQPTNGQLLIGSTGVDPVLGTLTAPAAGFTITGGAGTVTFALANGLASLEALAGTGIVVHTGADTYTERTITGTTDFIDVTNGDGVAANPTLSIATNFQATGMHGWNGSIIESAAVTVASDGATITLSVEKNGGGNLTVVTSLGYVTWVTAPDTIALTPGTDTVPVQNFVYWLESTGALTVSIVDFPSAEHAPIATVLCQTAATTATNLPLKVHAWTDHTTTTFDQGHIGDINHWIRHQNATWRSGVNQTYTITTNGGAADNVTINTASGTVQQLHDHSFPAFAGGHDYYVVNDFTTPYTKVTDLNALLTDSANVTMSGKYFSLVMWGVVSEVAADCKIFINLPSGSYNTATNVTADPSKFANFTIPVEFKGTGFLISQWNLRHQAAASGTWTSINEVDLRGFIPGVSAGSGTAAATQFPDTTFRIFDDGDSTKLIEFQASGITTANTRTITMPDQNVDLTPTTGTFQGSDAGLTDIAALAVTDSNFIVGDGLNWVAETGATARTSLGLGTIATQNANNVTISGGSITGITDLAVADGGTGASTFGDGYVLLGSGTGAITALDVTAKGSILVGDGTTDPVALAVGTNTYVLTADSAQASGLNWVAPTVGTVTSVSGTASRVTSTGGATPVIDIDATYVGQTSITTLGTIATGTWSATDVSVDAGGTGRSSHTAYAVICGGTTTTAAQQSIASVGTSGQVLTSNGAGALPTFQAAGGGGVLIQQVRTSTSALFDLSTTMPFDDTIPQSGEGNEILTLAITPTATDSILLVEATVSAILDAEGSSPISMAIFRDATADAIAAATVAHLNTGTSNDDVGSTGTIRVWVTSSSLDATTFKLRCGTDSTSGGSVNGLISNRKYGGVSSTTLTITEFSA